MLSFSVFKWLSNRSQEHSGLREKNSSCDKKKTKHNRQIFWARTAYKNVTETGNFTFQCTKGQRYDKRKLYSFKFCIFLFCFVITEIIVRKLVKRYNFISILIPALLQNNPSNSIVFSFGESFVIHFAFSSPDNFLLKVCNDYIFFCHFQMGGTMFHVVFVSKFLISVKIYVEGSTL